MNDPLIDRDGIARAMYLTPDHPDWKPCLALSESVLTYLRQVLTPEALTTVIKAQHGDYVTYHAADGTDIHRRIFGEDK